MSARFTLDQYQKEALLKSLKKYTLPLLLVFLVAIQQGTPIKEALYLVYGAALQLAINFLSKYVTKD